MLKIAVISMLSILFTLNPYMLSSSALMAAPFLRLMPNSELEEGEIEARTGSSSGVKYYFHRHLGSSQKQIIDAIHQHLIKTDTVSQELKSNASYQIVEISAPGKQSYGLFGGKGIYILDKQAIGYCLLEHKLNKNTPEAIEYLTAIKNLTLNPNFLSTELIIPANVQLRFFERISNGFVERYGIANMDGLDVLVLDSFYPVVLDSYLKSQIVEVLNQSLQFNSYLAL